MSGAGEMVGSRDAPAGGPSPSGVPLGGIGAGCIEFGRDGRFRNITINNNRLAHERIPLAPNAFFAVRAAVDGEARARILQPETGLPFDAAGIEAPCTPCEQFLWNGLYPESRYELAHAAFPVHVSWRILAPILPYDTEAAMLPLAIAVVSVNNPSDDAAPVTALMNWENLSGCSHLADWPAERGTTRFLARGESGEVEERIGCAREEERLIPLGLVFGGDKTLEANADGRYALCAAPQTGGTVTWTSYDKNDPEQVREMWSSFQVSGKLSNRVRVQAGAHCGAVAHSLTVPAKQRADFVFILSWYCPVYRLGGVSIGNGYTNYYDDAIDVALYGLKHYDYFLKAVRDWQGRFLESSLPTWYSRMLLNCTAPFSTNTILTRDNRFFTLESPESVWLSAIDTSFYASFATTLFYPSIADMELRALGQPVEGEGPRPAHSLGTVDALAPSFGPGGREAIDAVPKFILMVYRNYVLTGKLVSVNELYPRAREAVLYGLREDGDGDRIPDATGKRDIFDDGEMRGASAYTGGLWLVALWAFAILARKLGHGEDATHAEQIFQAARKQFEEKLWNEKAEYYRRCESPAGADVPGLWDACHCAQFAGPWYGALLQFSDIFDERRLQRAFSSAEPRLAPASGLRPAAPMEGDGRAASVGLPNLQAALFSSAELYGGRAEEAMGQLFKVYESIHRVGARPFNQPYAWDWASNRPLGELRERHAMALGLWHTLYAIEGLFLNVPTEELTVMPNLPKGVEYLRAPAFTPVCLGQLTYHLDSAAMRLSTTVSFESPIRIRRLRLRVPAAWGEVVVHLLADGGLGEARCVMTSQGAWRLVTIELKTSILVHAEVTATILCKSEDEKMEGEELGKRIRQAR